MLILTRKLEEAISIGDNIIFFFSGIKWNKVGITINSPKIPKFDQKEIYIKIGDNINITNKIKITILGRHGKQARFGIDAPFDVVIHRYEIYVKIQEENRTIKKPGLIQRFINLFKW